MNLSRRARRSLKTVPPVDSVIHVVTPAAAASGPGSSPSSQQYSASSVGLDGVGTDLRLRSPDQEEWWLVLSFRGMESSGSWGSHYLVMDTTKSTTTSIM